MQGRSRLALALVALAGCGSSQPSASCSIDRGVLPSWARGGFSDPSPKMPHVIGDNGRIAAILFGDPLSAPPPQGRANKILWVAKDAGTGVTDLHIRAVDGTRVVDRVVQGGPGPSIVDLPAGCWSLTLTWAGQTDHLSLAYS
jgi:hypothetical protein